MGTWTTSVVKTSTPEVIFAAAISYSIPLSEPSTKAVVLNRTETEESTTTPVEGCEFELESLTAVPVAPPGVLCVFTTEEASGEPKYTVPPGIAYESEKDSPSGALIAAKTAGESSGVLRLAGVWAVTAQ
jgi:hypothetical protein